VTAIILGFLTVALVALGTLAIKIFRWPISGAVMVGGTVFLCACYLVFMFS